MDGYAKKAGMNRHPVLRRSKSASFCDSGTSRAGIYGLTDLFTYAGKHRRGAVQ